MASLYANELREELALIKAEMNALTVNGQIYGVTGSHSREGVRYSDLKRRRNEIIVALAQLQSVKSYTLPDFS